MNRVCLVFCLSIASLVTTSLSAQDREQRREFIQDLLKGLIESQLDRDRDPQRPRPGVPSQLPGQVQRPGWPSPSRPGNRPGDQSGDIGRIRRTALKFNESAAELVTEIRKHEFESPQLRPLLADSLNFQAGTNALVQQANLVANPTFLVNDFLSLDRQWRILAMQLQQARGLPRRCANIIDSISKLDQELGDLFGVQPQIDRIELSRLAATLVNDYDHLMQGLYYASRGNSGSEGLMRQGRRLQTMIGQAAGLIDRGSYETIVDAYRQCQSEWGNFSHQVLQLQDQRLRYSVQHIEDTGRKIQQQLFLPIEVDVRYLASLTDSITTDAERMFESISMKELMSTSQPGNLLALSREFDQTSRMLSEQLKNGTPMDQMEWTFRLLNTKWLRMTADFQQLQSNRIRHRLDDIQMAMGSLSDVFGVGSSIDRNSMLQMFAQMDALCKQASQDLNQRIRPGQYSVEFCNQIYNIGDSLSRQVFSLHREVARYSFQPSENRMQSLMLTWQQLKSMLAQCQPQDRAHFSEFRRQMEPMMVKVQVLFNSVPAGANGNGGRFPR